MAVEYRKVMAIENGAKPGVVCGQKWIPTKESNMIIKEAGKHEAKYHKNNCRQGMRHNKMQFHFVMQNPF